MVKKAIIYCRVAVTDRCGLKTNKSIKHQKSVCLGYARKRGYRVLDTIQEQGSGLKINKGLATCIKKLFEAKADVLIATEPSRLTRSSIVFSKIRQLLGNRLELFSSSGQKNSAKRDLMDAILMSIFEYEKTETTRSK